MLPVEQELDQIRKLARLIKSIQDLPAEKQTGPLRGLLQQLQDAKAKLDKQLKEAHSGNEPWPTWHLKRLEDTFTRLTEGKISVPPPASNPIDLTSGIDERALLFSGNVAKAAVKASPASTAASQTSAKSAPLLPPSAVTGALVI